jgi:chemotaxis protein CheZ
MAEPRKIFRIEEMVATRLGECPEDAPPPADHAELMAELTALRAVVAAANQSRKPDALANAKAMRASSELDRIAGVIGAGKVERAASMTRIAKELDAVVKGTEQSTQKVLAAAEEIDQAANNLSAALKGKTEQDLAQDIRDIVIQIFEACNFQDLAGQRVTKVMATLKLIEDHVVHVLDEFKNAATARRHDGTQYLHGPRLDSDPGHASQADVDAMFSGGNN